MARRSIWNGAISFGMVVIPVKLYTATDSKDFSFVNLHSTCNTRIRQPRFCPHHEVQVESSEIVRAYEYAKEQYILMDESPRSTLPLPRVPRSHRKSTPAGRRPNPISEVARFRDALWIPFRRRDDRIASELSACVCRYLSQPLEISAGVLLRAAEEADRCRLRTTSNVWFRPDELAGSD